MMFCPAIKAVYTAPCKTATQTMFEVLREWYDGTLLANVNMHDPRIPPQFHDWFSFITVRNPYDRAVSLWWSTTQRTVDKYQFRQLCPRPDDFTSFCQWLATDAPDRDLTWTMSQYVKLERIDAILHFETLQQDFAKLPLYRGEPGTWPHENQTINSREPWQHYMTDEAAMWVQRWAGEDFDTFGYERAIHAMV